MTRRSQALAVVVSALAALFVLSIQCLWLWPFISDDAFISLRYAERLASGSGLTWNDGERVEGYSNLLWVLLLAMLLKLGVPALATLRLLGAVLAAGTIALLACHARPRHRSETPAALATPLLFAASAPMAAWTLGGLEGPLTVLLLAWGLVALRRAVESEPGTLRLLAAGIPFALLCWTRPEAPLWIGSLAVAIGVARLRASGVRAAAGDAAALLALPLAALLLQLAFRLAYYGEWVANSTLVKIPFSLLALRYGRLHVAVSVVVLVGLFAGGALGVLAAWRTRVVLRAALPLAVVVPHMLLVAAVGGDHFVAWRLMIPVLPPLALLSLEGLRWLASGSAASRRVGLLLCTGLPALLFWSARMDSVTARARNEHFEWQGQAIGETLHRHFGAERPLLAVDGAGAMPFFSRLPALDMLGLNDRVIARTPPPPPYKNRFAPAHMHANGAYVLGRRPDIVQYGGPPGLLLPAFESDRELERSPEFLRDYRCIVFELPEPLQPGKVMRCLLWLRLEGRIGVRRSDDRIEVPGYLAHSLRQPASLGVWSVDEIPVGDPRVPVLEVMHRCVASPHASVSAPDGLLLELRATAPTALADLEVPAGRWRAECAPAGAPIEVRLRDRQEALPREAGAFAWHGGPLTVEVLAATGASLPVRLRSVTLLRVP